MLPWTMVEQIWTESVMEGEVEHQQSMLQIQIRFVPVCKLFDEQDIAELRLVIRCCPGVWPAPEVEVIYVKAWFGMLIR